MKNYKLKFAKNACKWADVEKAVLKRFKTVSEKIIVDNGRGQKETKYDHFLLVEDPKSDLADLLKIVCTVDENLVIGFHKDYLMITTSSYSF